MIHSNKRRGGALVIALLTLMVVMLLAGAVLRTLLAARRQTMSANAALQAAWLAESALDRALARRASDGDYGGETWNVEILNANDEPIAAVVNITVNNEVSEKWISVSADFDGASVSKRTEH